MTHQTGHFLPWLLGQVQMHQLLVFLALDRGQRGHPDWSEAMQSHFSLLAHNICYVLEACPLTGAMMKR